MISSNNDYIIFHPVLEAIEYTDSNGICFKWA